MGRFAVDLDGDHSATLWIATLLSAVYTTCSLVVRICIKRTSFGLDDVVFLVAQMFAYGEFIAIMVGIASGLGRSLELLEGAQEAEVMRVWTSSQIFFILSTTAAKFAVGLLLRRIFSRLESKHAALLCDILLGVSGLWGVASILAVSVSCDAAHILPGHETAQCAATVG